MGSVARTRPNRDCAAAVGYKKQRIARGHPLDARLAGSVGGSPETRAVLVQQAGKPCGAAELPFCQEAEASVPSAPRSPRQLAAELVHQRDEDRDGVEQPDDDAD